VSGNVFSGLTLGELQLLHQGLCVIGEQNRVDERLIGTWRSLLERIGIQAGMVVKGPLLVDRTDVIKLLIEMSNESARPSRLADRVAKIRSPCSWSV
jgi:hypothetical protein